MNTNLTNSDDNVLIIINGLGIFLSLVGEFSILIRTRQRKIDCSIMNILIISMAITDMIFTFSNILSFFQFDTVACILEAFIRDASIISSTGWILSMMLTKLAQFKYRIFDQCKKFKYILLVNISFSLLVPIIEIVTNYVYVGNFDNLFCGLREGDYLYLVLINCLYLLLISVLIVSINMMKEIKKALPDKWGFEFHKMLFYPMIFILIWAPDFISAFIILITDSSPGFFLIFLQILFTRMQGIIHSVIFYEGERHNLAIKEPSIEEAEEFDRLSSLDPHNSKRTLEDALFLSAI